MLWICSWPDSAWLASTSTLASTQAPPSASASRSSTGQSCLHGPHQSAQKSTSTGTVHRALQDLGLEGRLGDVEDVHARAAGRRAPAAAAGAGGGRGRSDERSTAPAMFRSVGSALHVPIQPQRRRRAFPAAAGPGAATYRGVGDGAGRCATRAGGPCATCASR